MNAQLETHTVEELFKRNDAFIESYRLSSLMHLIRSPFMAKRKARQTLLDLIQVFSNYFQKVVMLRSVFTENIKFHLIALDHLKEEFCHNEKLMADRHYQAPAWDPILEATSSWFAWKMLTLNDEERTVLVHLVLEASANIFFQEAHQVMHHYGETDYFKIHSDVDEQHEQMGKALLYDLTPRQYARLLAVQSQGWSILMTACDRIAELTSVNCSEKNPVLHALT